MNEPYDPVVHPVKSRPYSGRSQDGLLPNAAAPGTSAQKDKIQAIHSEVDQAKDELNKTVLKLQERGELMEDLQHKTDSLALKGQAFRNEARKTRRAMWVKNAKWTICLGMLIALIIAGIVTGAVRGSQIVKEREKTIVHESKEAVNVSTTGSSSSGEMGPAATGDVSKPTTTAVRV